MLALFALDQRSGGPITADAISFARDTVPAPRGDYNRRPSPRFS